QQVAQRLGFRDEERRAHRRADAEGGGLAGAHVLEQVAGVEDAHDVVERAVVHRQAAVAGLLQHLLYVVGGGPGPAAADLRPGGISLRAAAVGSVNWMTDSIISRSSSSTTPSFSPSSMTERISFSISFSMVCGSVEPARPTPRRTSSSITCISLVTGIST